MNPIDMLILYVADPAASTAYYTKVLGRGPVDESSNFVMFKPESGPALGLWRSSDVHPAPGGGSGHEWVIMCRDAAAVDAAHAAWPGMTSAPVTAEFGHSFIATDPDGHRIRVLAPA